MRPNDRATLRAQARGNDAHTQLSHTLTRVQILDARRPLMIFAVIPERVSPAPRLSVVGTFGEANKIPRDRGARARMRPMRALGRVTVALILTLVACGGSDSDAPSSGVDGGASSSSGGGGSTTGDGGDEGGLINGVPSLCFADDISDKPNCVVDAVGVFVDGAGGDDANDGSRAKPLKTIDAALKTTAKRVFVCAGDYAPLSVTRAVLIDGGFACDTWQYAGTKPKVHRANFGYALTITAVSGAVSVSDFDLLTPDATTSGGSSITVSVVSSSDVTLRRTTVQAGSGSAGTDGTSGVGAGTPTPLDLKGNPPNGATPGAAKTCTCDTGGTSVGGGGVAPGVNINGGSGLPNHAENPAGHDGLGGITASCEIAEPNGTGNDGADAPASPPAVAVTKRGSLTSAGFTPSKGGDGANGLPGQGGGGGATTNATKAGSGGGCGGCGGRAGFGGQGGGASVAIVSFESSIKLIASTLSTGVAGGGGRGGTASAGAAGGLAGSGHFSGSDCTGGAGGKGGDGGAGAGGAGGISVGVLFSGTAPVVDAATTITTGAAGTPGAGGVSANTGPSGLSVKTQDANTL